MDDWRGEGEDFYYCLTGIRDGEPYRKIHRWLHWAAENVYRYNITNVKLVGYRKHGNHYEEENWTKALIEAVRLIPIMEAQRKEIEEKERQERMKNKPKVVFDL